MYHSLNLTAATHVHLVEPQWNPMVEAQAAARVDRLDQDKNVVILRYVVKDSIEKVHERQARLFIAPLILLSEHKRAAAAQALARKAFHISSYNGRHPRSGKS